MSNPLVQSKLQSTHLTFSIFFSMDSPGFFECSCVDVAERVLTDIEEGVKQCLKYFLSTPLCGNDFYQPIARRVLASNQCNFLWQMN